MYKCRGKEIHNAWLGVFVHVLLLLFTRTLPLTLASTCLSLMMYSYVVSKTLNFPLRSWGTKALLAAGDP